MKHIYLVLILLFPFFISSQNNGSVFHEKHEMQFEETSDNHQKFHFANTYFTESRLNTLFPDLIAKKEEAKANYNNGFVPFDKAFTLLFNSEANEFKNLAVAKGDLSKEALRELSYELFGNVVTKLNNPILVKSLYEKQKFLETQYALGSGYSSKVTAACTNVDFANGTTSGWQCSWGTGAGNQINTIVGYEEHNDCTGLTETYNPVTRQCCWPYIWLIQSAGCRTPAFSTVAITANVNNPAVTLTANSGAINTPANAGTPGVHTIMTGGTDPLVPISVVPPGGGNSIRLGHANTGSYKAQRIRQTFTVGAGNPNFVYQYAAVLQDPVSNHTISDQPYFKIRMFDQSNNEIDCATYDINAISAQSIGGFIKKPGTDYLYKNWSTVTVPLLAYVGQNVTIEFTTSDCAQSGHFGYAYIQCLCSPMPIVSTLPVVCNGQTTTLTAPAGAATYTWTGPSVISGANTQTAVVNVGGTYTVNMTTFYTFPQVPCNYSQSITLGAAPAAASSSFTSGPVCLGAPNTFTNTSSGTGIFQYIWNFGDGSPTFTTATATNPVHTYTAANNYSVSLIADNGCPQPFSLPLAIKPQPNADFTLNSSCMGAATSFTNASTAPTPATFTSHTWNFGDGNTSGTIGNATHTFTAPNTYSVSLLVVNDQLCRDSVTKTITIYPNPLISVGSTTVCLNLTTAFTNSSSVAAPDNISTWAWDFDNNGTTDNGAQFPTNTFTTVGTHTVELKATTNNGCRDSTTIPVLVNAIQTANFTANNTCLNSAIGIVNTTTVTPPDFIMAYNWDFGTGANPATGTGYNPTLPSYSSSGTKTITLNLTANTACTVNLVQTIQVYAQPVANFSTTSVCQSIVTAFTDMSTPNGSITNWQWDFLNDGSIDNTGNAPTNVYASSGTFSASLIVTDNNTCKDTVVLPLNVWGHAIPDFIPGAVCFGATTTFTNLTNTTTNANVGGTPGYTWDFADGSPVDVITNPSHTYTNGIGGATYNVTLTATTSNNCIDNIVKPVKINALPTATFVPLSACLNSNVALNNTSTIPLPDNIATHAWNFGTGATPATSGIQNPLSLSYNASGVKTITLTVTANTTCSASITQTVVVFPQPIANFSTTSVCQSTATAFTDLSISSGTVTNWQWDFLNDGSIDNTSNAPTNVYASSGTFSASLIVTDNYTCKDTIVLPLNVWGHSIPDFTPNAVCFGSTTTFTNLTNTTTNTNVGGISGYAWDFADSSPVDNTTDPTHTYTNGIGGATYNVTLTATTIHNCVDNVVKPVKINALPTATFSPLSACLNSNVGLNNTSIIPLPDNITIYNWNFGSTATPATSGMQNPPLLSYGTSGIKTITLTVTANTTCSASITQTITVFPQPIANFSTTSVCQSTATTFTDLSISSGTVTNWQWDFLNDGSVDNTSNAPTNVYASSGTFSASLIVTDNNTCKDTVVLPVDVWGHAIPDFTPNNVCYGAATTFTNLTNLTTNANVGGTPSYVWDFSDGTPTSFLTDPVHTYTLGVNANATYNATLTVTSAHNCIDNIIKTVSVYAIPTASFTSDSVCLGSVSHMMDASNGNGNTLSNYEWDFLSNSTVDITGVANPNFTFPAYGINAVTYTVSTTPIVGLTCKNTTNTITVWVNPNPVPDFTFTNKCINAQPNTFDANSSSIAIGTNTNYAWAYGDGNNGTGITSTHNYATAQTYNSTLTVTSNKGCQSTIIKQVDVYQKPFSSINTTQTCDREAMSFTGVTQSGSTPIANWYWDFNNSVSSIEAATQTPSYVFPSAGTQTVVLITESVIGACRDTLTKIVYVDHLPVPMFTVDRPSGCPLPHCVVFTDQTAPIPAPGQNVDWKWVLGDGKIVHSSTNGTQRNCYTNTSSNQIAFFDVKLVVTTDKGCTDSLLKSSFIKVFPKPIAQYTVNPNPSNVLTPLVYFTNQSQDFNKWWWNFGDNQFVRDSINLDPTHYYEGVSAGTYPSYLIVENMYTCRDTAYVAVEITPEFTFYIPNAFTPANGDGINDVFTGAGIGIEKFEMWIFDRWGARIYYTDDIRDGWNGKVQGKEQEVQQDVYIWKVKLKDVLGKTHEYIGHVTLVR